ncbi:hypothetical protein A3A70_03325 [candidate division WWE3 bacterium RIFCSPLOWO2_01_FULL_42_11]|uniref:Uncharacterized protein n=1 Tax=candidate division WWE3 bacterium RIFCSPLOWO2_01_FULL_42_11 TaxID=1802627 RepID=A0A1F4VM42_UNCKA|nr:MAG: hypothetical protein A3A70_03325 [candidate division WWE3 bacterium RIFCSPLOWO2_01_FULL_42_11]
MNSFIKILKNTDPKIILFMGALTLFGGILSPVLWPPAEGVTLPSLTQLPFFMFLVGVESFTFALGVVFLMKGRPLIERLTEGSKLRGQLMYFSIAWQLMSWLPHDGFHRSIGMDITGLLFLEYAFHLTLIMSSMVIAYCFFKPLESGA